MADHSLYGKRELCYTEVVDFTDFEGIGSDPLYKRYDSVYSVINKYVPEEYKDFLAQPIYSDVTDQIKWYCKEWTNVPEKFKDLSPEESQRYLQIKEKTLAVYQSVIASLKGEDLAILRSAVTHIDNDFLFCYDDKVVAVAWGMAPDTTQHKVYGTIIHGFDFQKRRTLRFEEGEHGSFATKIDGKMTRPEGTILTERDIPNVKAKEGYAFRCWNPEPIGHKVTGDMVFTAQYDTIVVETPDMVTVRFEDGGHGSISGEESVVIEKGSYLDPSQIPSIRPGAGYRFTGWDISTDGPIESDITLNAQYEQENVNCIFDAGEFGTLNGTSHFSVPYGSSILSSNIPAVTPKKGYKFTGWNIPPTSAILDRDMRFTAQYEKEERIPWYRRLWLFLTGRGCLKWLLWLLLLLLLLFLLSQLLRSCDGRPATGIGGIGNDGVVPTEEVIGNDGNARDDNGAVQDIIGEDGRLPDNNVIAPIVGEDGSLPPVSQSPGAPDVISNRLNIYFEDSNVDFNQFAADFKQVYPGDEYKIIGYDPEVEFMQIQIPESQRDNVRERLNSQLPNYNFFVVDESIFTLSGRQSEDTSDAGWHLKAINLKEGWKITKGKSDIIVAVVDDGIDPDHEILKGRIVEPYNVFTQNNHLSKGQGHGTHVAGLAVGSDKYFDRGVSGVAPKCKLMPVQVFDNEVCTFSSVTSGIMYAIHHGADVINVSIGPNFSGLDILPVEQQNQIAQTQFLNEEKVWRKIIRVANEKNAILVLAVGNDNILANVPPECRTNNTLNVSAVSKEFKVTEFSNYGSGANISAPGQSIASSYSDNQYAIFDGTSMSAPIVAGTVALLKSKNKDISINEVRSILQQSGRSVTGNIPPMIQVDRALIMQRDGTVANTAASEDSTEAQDAQQTDYDAIRRMIEQYKQKINELERMLPENNNR